EWRCVDQRAHAGTGCAGGSRWSAGRGTAAIRLGLNRGGRAARYAGLTAWGCTEPAARGFHSRERRGSVAPPRGRGALGRGDDSATRRAPPDPARREEERGVDATRPALAFLTSAALGRARCRRRAAGCSVL